MAEKVPNEIFTSKQCKKCGLVEPVTYGEVSDVHGYKLHCPHCGMYVGWGGKTQAIKNGNGERVRSSQWTAKRLNADHCEMCQRRKDFLGKGERLEIHHVLEISQGGEDVPENIWILCTACHRIVHHQRTYLYEHQKKFMDSYEALQRFKEKYPDLYRRVRGKDPDDDNANDLRTGTDN
jgi:5-methylcytosine-specific restriction endonuclease McrA